MEWSRKPEKPGDLRRGVIPLISKLQEKPISRGKLGESPLEPGLQFRALETLVRICALATGHFGDVDVGRKSHGEAASENEPGSGFPSGLPPYPAKEPPLMFQAQPASYNHEPRCESGLPIRRELAEPAEIGFSKSLEHRGIAIHGGVSPTPEGPADVEQERRYRRQKLLPGLVARRALAREQRNQLRRKRSAHELKCGPPYLRLPLRVLNGMPKRRGRGHSVRPDETGLICCMARRAPIAGRGYFNPIRLTSSANRGSCRSGWVALTEFALQALAARAAGSEAFVGVRT